MKPEMKAAITGVHGYVPDYVMTNDELSTMVDTSDEWITTRTGIKERRVLKDRDRGSAFMGTEAVRGLLEKSATDPETVDFMICATATPDMPFPATANLICDAVGAKNAFGYDLSAACSGFLFALVTASQFVANGSCRKAIVVGVDKMSAILDYKDRTTCILFGDGAGAVLLEPTTDGVGVMDAVLKSDGSGAPYLYMKAGGSLRPASAETIAAREHFVRQEGSTVFRFAVKSMAQVAVDIMNRNRLKPEDISFLVPHQANKRIIDATANRMGIGEDKVLLNIHRYGNTTNGTIPLCLHDFESRFQKGDNLVFAAFGGGFTWGAVYVKWAYDGPAG
jgi:3-oxoacyl-[acyl-carrier-protein] synthase-3